MLHRLGGGGGFTDKVTFFKVVLNPFLKYDWMWDVDISSYTVGQKQGQRQRGGN